MRDVSSYREDLLMNAIIHDQDLFAASEVMALGNQTYAPSRRALLISLVAQGVLDWEPSVVDSVYSALNVGVQHAFSVYGGSADAWPDERGYVLAARREIVNAGCEPDSARSIRDAYRAGGHPYDAQIPVAISPSKVTLLCDASMMAYDPGSVEAARELVRRIYPDAGIVAGLTCGYELYMLGYADEARGRLNEVLGQLGAAECERVITDSPEAYTALTSFAHQLELDVPMQVMHLSEALAERSDVLDSHERDSQTCVQDSAELVRFDDGMPIRTVLGRVSDLCPMMYERHEVIPAGALPGFPHPGINQPMARRRLDEAKAACCEVLLTVSPFDYVSLRNTRDEGDPDVHMWTTFLLTRLEN